MQDRTGKNRNLFPQYWGSLSVLSVIIRHMINNTPSSPARDALNAARSAHYALRDAYADPSRPPAAGTAAALHTEVKYGLRVAQVEASLEVASELRSLREALTGASSTVEVTRRLAAARAVRTVADATPLRDLV